MVHHAVRLGDRAAIRFCHPILGLFWPFCFRDLAVGLGRPIPIRMPVHTPHSEYICRTSSVATPLQFQSCTKQTPKQSYPIMFAYPQVAHLGGERAGREA